MQRVRREIGCEWMEPQKNSYSGRGVTVAVLDTGIALHPDFSNRSLIFKDFIYHRSDPYDDAGHGTHVAGCLAGSGLLSGGRFRGVAPGCNLVICKILDHNGVGDSCVMVNALRWILTNKERFRIRILNISIGFEDRVKSERIRELLNLLDEIWESGILIVVAAGNKGPDPGSISALGMGRNVLTVGCHDGSYLGNGETLCSEYSGRGPSTCVMKKPDLVAPGTRIIAASARCRRYKIGYEHAYEAKSGTSFAAPLVSGALALLLEKNPELTAVEAKRKLCYSARDLQESWSKQGWGMLNVERMLKD